jgi:phosphatidylinositol kinase/protein kinase (PI-3  family)
LKLNQLETGHVTSIGECSNLTTTNESPVAERIYTESESLKKAIAEFVESLYKRATENGLTYSIVSLEADWKELKRQCNNESSELEATTNNLSLSHISIEELTTQMGGSLNEVAEVTKAKSKGSEGLEKICQMNNALVACY